MKLSYKFFNLLAFIFLFCFTFVSSPLAQVSPIFVQGYGIGDAVTPTSINNAGLVAIPGTNIVGSYGSYQGGGINGVNFSGTNFTSFPAANFQTGYVSLFDGFTLDHFGMNFKQNVFFGYININGADFDSSGNFYYGGSFSGWVYPEILGGVSSFWINNQAYVTKIGNNAVPLWSRLAATTSSPIFVSSVFTDPSGDIYITGRFSGGATFGWTSQSNITGYTSYGLNDAFISKWTPNTLHLWTTRIGGSGDDNGVKGDVLPNGDVVFVANVDTTQNPGNPATGHGLTDVYIATLNPTTGAVNSLDILGGSGHDFVSDVVADPVANVAYITGNFENSVHLNASTTPLATTVGTRDGFVGSFSSSAANWFFTDGTAGSVSKGQRVTLDACGNLLQAGTQPNSGANDSFVRNISAPATSTPFENWIYTPGWINTNQSVTGLVATHSVSGTRSVVAALTGDYIFPGVNATIYLDLVDPMCP